MKIYNRIVIENGKILEEDSFEYEGPLALCDGGGDDAGDASGDMSGSWEDSDISGFGSDFSSTMESDMGGGWSDSMVEAEMGSQISTQPGMSGGWESSDISGFGTQFGTVDFQGIKNAYTEDQTGMFWGMKSLDTKDKLATATGARTAGAVAGAVTGSGLLGLGLTAVGLAIAENIARDKAATNYAVSQMESLGYSQAQIDAAKSAAKASSISANLSDSEADALMSGTASPEQQNEIAQKVYQNATPAVKQQIDSAVKEVHMANVTGNIDQLLNKGIDYDRVNELMDVQLSDLVSLSEAHTLAELTGGLSDEESALLDRMRTNSIANLTEIVNEETEGLVKSKIADLTARGVLSGNVGTQALQEIDKYRAKTVTQGTRDIETALAEKELNLRQQNKTNQLQLWNLENQRELAEAGFATDIYKSKLGMAGDLTKSQAAWDASRLNALTSIYGAELGAESDAARTAAYLESAKLGSQSSWDIANLQKDYSEDASKWNLWGNVAQGASSALMYSLWS
jgi:hypothetical protein